MRTVASLRADPTGSTCIIATTPWSGSQRLGTLLAASGSAPPRSWFDPLLVPRSGRRMGLSVGQPDWADRYLEAVQRRATVGGTCTVSLTWTQQRWLVQVARSVLAARGVAAGSVDDTSGPIPDTEVLGAWFPDPTYVWVRSRGTDVQALRWYFGRHQGVPVSADWLSEPGAVDLAEVRWLETMLVRYERGWSTWFRIHGIEPLVVHYEDLVDEPIGTLDALVGALGRLPSADRVGAVAPPELVVDPAEALADRWAGAYRRVRHRLPTTVGVRAVIG